MTKVSAKESEYVTMHLKNMSALGLADKRHGNTPRG